MKAIVKPKPVEDQEWKSGFQFIEKPEPKIENPNDVLIEVFAGGICGTDVGIYHGKGSLKKEMLQAVVDPVTIGHEFSGRIVDAGKTAKQHLAKLVLQRTKKDKDLKSLLKRRTVSSLSADPKFLNTLEKKFYATAEMHITCGKCYQCRLGEYHVCRNTIIKGLHDDGAWSTYVKVPAENIRIFFGREIPLEIIGFMDAIGNATHTVLSAPVKNRSVVILGLGVQGLLAVAVAKWSGAKKIYVTDASRAGYPHAKMEQNRFALARRYGADHCFDVALPEERARFLDTILSETDGTGADAVYEMSGSYRAYVDAAKIIRMGGVFSLLGIPAGSISVDFAKNIIFKGITINGIIGRKVFKTWDQMEALLKSGLANQLLKTGFVSHQFPLDQYEKAFATIQSGEAFKVLLKP